MNLCMLTGRTTKEIELKKTANGMSYVQFSLAVRREKTREGQQETDFISCVAFDKTAEFMEKHIKKGDGIEVTGRISTREYDDKDGKKVYVTEVIVNNIGFGVGGNKGNTQKQEQPVEDPFGNIF